MELAPGQTKAAAWLDRIDRARRLRGDQEQDWDENRRMLNSVSYTDGPSKYDRVYVNHFLSLCRIVVPLLYYKNPQFTCLPLRSEDERTYKIAEQAVNYWARVCDLKHACKEMILDALVASFGVLKVGWVIEPLDLRLKVNDDGTREIIDDSVEQAQSAVQLQLVQAGIGSRPFTVRVSPWNIVRSVGSTSIRNASWVAERVYKRLEEVKNDPLYKNTAKLKPNSVPGNSAWQWGASSDSVHSDVTGDEVDAARALADPDDQLIELWEVWDRSNPNKPMQYVIAPGVDDPILEREWPYDLDGRYPYIELRFIDIPDEAYPISFLSAVKDLVKELNIIACYELDFVKRANPKIGYDKTRVNEETDLQALRRGEPIQAVGVAGDPRSAIASVGGVTLNPDLKWVHLKTQEDLQLISGIADFMRGGSSDPSQLATVANIQVQALSMMTQDMMDRVADVLIEWSMSVDALSKEYCDKPQMIRITGQTGFAWQQFTKEDLQGQYEYQIVPGSLQPLNREIELKQRLDLFNLLAPFINVQEMGIDGKELIRSIADLFPIKNIDRILRNEPEIPPSDPAEENFLLEEGGNPVVSPREDFAQHLAIHGAFLQQKMMQGAEPMLVDRIKKHLEATQKAQQEAAIKAQLEMAMKLQMMQTLQGGGAPPDAGPPPPNGPPRAPGNGGPAANGPIRPRLMSEDQPEKKTIMAASRRGAVAFPGHGPDANTPAK